MGDIIDLAGKPLETEPKLVGTKSIRLVMEIYDNNMMMPTIVPAEGMSKYETHYWISKFLELAGQ